MYITAKKGQYLKSHNPLDLFNVVFVYSYTDGLFLVCGNPLSRQTAGFFDFDFNLKLIMDLILLFFIKRKHVLCKFSKLAPMCVEVTLWAKMLFIYNRHRLIYVAAPSNEYCAHEILCGLVFFFLKCVALLGRHKVTAQHIIQRN